MSREIYKRSVAPHNLRVGVDGGVPSDNVQAQILLMQDTQPDIDAGLVRLLVSPELFGTKQRTSAPYLFATKGYSANSLQRELGDELITNVADREFTSDTGYYTKAGESTINAGGSGVARIYSSAGAFSSIERIGVVVSGKQYKVNYKVSAVVSGSLQDTNSVVMPSALGWNTHTFNAINNIFGIKRGVGITDISIDEISIREVLPADLTQTTANSQPYDDKIAPSEPRGLKNTNGDARFMSHSAISFAANEKWEYTVVLKRNSLSNTEIAGANGGGSMTINPLGQIGFISKTTLVSTGATLNQLIGKYQILTYQADGLGGLKIFNDGVLLSTFAPLENRTVIDFSLIGTGRNNPARVLFGNIAFALLKSGNSPDSSIAYLASLLRSIFPEIPTVKVAGLDCAVRALDVVCTPAGNVIANVTDNAAWAALTTPAWCHHSNDLALGSVYGKIYNGYAKDLLVADLASSNFGYHVATKAELTAIMANGLGVKMIGTAYWNTANGTNLTGLSLLGSGYRGSDGAFGGSKTVCVIWCADVDERLEIQDGGAFNFAARVKASGYSLLLIKNY